MVFKLPSSFHEKKSKICSAWDGKNGWLGKVCTPKLAVHILLSWVRNVLRWLICFHLRWWMRSEPVREIFAQCGDAGPRYSLPMLPTIFDAKNAFLHAPLPTGQVVISRTLGSRLNDKMIRRGTVFVHFTTLRAKRAKCHYTGAKSNFLS